MNIQHPQSVPQHEERDGELKDCLRQGGDAQDLTETSQQGSKECIDDQFADQKQQDRQPDLETARGIPACPCRDVAFDLVRNGRCQQPTLHSHTTQATSGKTRYKCNQ